MSTYRRACLTPLVVAARREGKVGALNGFNGIYEWITKLGRLFPPRVCTWLAARGCTEGGHALGQRTAQTLL